MATEYRQFWCEVPKSVGEWLWGALREHLKPGQLGALETLTDPEGNYGHPCVRTVVGTREGLPILWCETTGQREEVQTHRYFVWTSPKTLDQLQADEENVTVRKE